jgi:hypothetical protein
MRAFGFLRGELQLRKSSLLSLLLRFFIVNLVDFILFTSRQHYCLELPNCLSASDRGLILEDRFA